MSINPQDWLEFGQKFHGHKCPAMPLGLRAAAEAMNVLEVGRTGDSDLIAILDLGEDHCATCFADGVQVLTGCTLGKGNIKRSHKGKWAVTLVDKHSRKAVRVSALAKAMQANKETSFLKDYRSQGVPPTQIPDEVVEPLIIKVMTAPPEKILTISEPFDYDYKSLSPSFSSFICESCGEMTAEPYGRIKDGKQVCQDCV